jgi:hypothetical protein
MIAFKIKLYAIPTICSHFKMLWIPFITHIRYYNFFRTIPLVDNRYNDIAS